MRTSAIRVVAVLLAWAPAAAPAGNAELQRFLESAKTLRQSLEYERALEQVRRARGLSPTLDESVMLALLEGVLLFELDRPGEAHGAFHEGLSLNPTATLPWKVSPKVSAAFEGALDELRRRRARGEEGKDGETGAHGLSPAGAGAIVGFVSSALAAASGIGCAVAARQRYDALEQTTVAPADALETRDSGKRLQIASGVLFGLSAASLLTGVLLLGSGASDSAPKAALVLAPGAGAFLVLSGALP